MLEAETTLQFVNSTNLSTEVKRQDLLHPGPWLEIHRNFASCVFRTVRLHDGPSNEIAQLSKQWAEWDVLTSLANYRVVVQTMFKYLKDSSLHRASAVEVSNRLSQDSTRVLQQINSLLSDRTTYKHFVSCRGVIAQQLLDLLQDLLDSSHELRSRPLISKALLRLSGECGLHPTCFPLVGLEKVGPQVAGGGFGDIFKGLVGGQSVAVKSMRQFKDDDVRVSLKKLGREAVIWRQLSHPNLLPFFGLYVLDNRPSLISPWMDNGDLKNFLNNAPSDINRIALITDVAMGLEYLHRNNVVHGDLKTVNILVTPSGRACIADFRLASIVDELSLKMTFSSRSGRAGTVRYQAPELLANERSSHFGSDVYAFACVCYEILTGKVPFYEIPNEMAVAIKVTNGARPPKPQGIFPEYLWPLVDDCWRQKADERPTTAVTLQRLRQPIGETTNQSPPDWDDSYSAKFRRSIQEWPLLPSIAEIERRMPSNTTGIDDAVSVALKTVGDTEGPFHGHTQADQPNVTAVHHEELAGHDRTSPQQYPARLSLASRTQDRSPLTAEFDWEDAGKRNWDGASTSTCDEIKHIFWSGSAAGQRSRTNSIVTRDNTDSSVSRESGASLTSAKTDMFEVVMLSPNTLLFPAARSVDLLSPFPGMKKLEEQRRAGSLLFAAEETLPPVCEPSPTDLPSPTGAVVGSRLHPVLPEIHSWLTPDSRDAPLFLFHFDLAPTVFSPLRRFRNEPPHKVSDIAEFRESAFRPAVTALQIVHPRIAFWPIDLNLPFGVAADSFPPITIGDVLVGIHQAMHQPVTSRERAFLHKPEQFAVDWAFNNRCRDEAKMIGCASPQDERSREVAIRKEGLKRIDYLRGKTLFKGLVSVPGDPPGCMRMVTA